MLIIKWYKVSIKKVFINSPILASSWTKYFYRVFMIAMFLWPFVCKAPETHWESWSPEVRSLKIIGFIVVL